MSILPIKMVTGENITVGFILLWVFHLVVCTYKIAKDCPISRKCDNFECGLNDNCMYRICTGARASFSCTKGVIKMISTFFGRRRIDVCQHRNAIKDCVPEGNMKQEHTRNGDRLCTNETKCELRAAFNFKDACGKDVWGDKCPSKPKYILVNFTCIDTSPLEFWVKWSDWSTCSLSCGQGLRQRVRNCKDPVDKECTKSTCKAKKISSEKQTENCNSQPCPVNGNYTEWSEFGNCSRNCGGGYKTRTRTCTNPAPENGGKNCSQFGRASETKICNEQICLGTKSRILVNISSSQYIFTTNSVIPKLSTLVALSTITASAKNTQILSSQYSSGESTKTLSISASTFETSGFLSKTSTTSSMDLQLISSRFSSVSTISSHATHTYTKTWSIQTDSVTITRYSAAFTTFKPLTDSLQVPHYYAKMALLMTWKDFCSMIEKFKDLIISLHRTMHIAISKQQVVMMNLDHCRTVPSEQAVVEFYISTNHSVVVEKDLTQVMVNEIARAIKTGMFKGSTLNGTALSIQLVSLVEHEEKWPAWLTTLIVLACIIIICWVVCCVWICCTRRNEEGKRKWSMKKNDAQPQLTFSKSEVVSTPVFKSTISVSVTPKVNDAVNPGYEMGDFQEKSDRIEESVKEENDEETVESSNKPADDVDSQSQIIMVINGNRPISSPLIKGWEP